MTYSPSRVAVICCIIVVMAGISMPDPKSFETILVFGGNGFIGSECVQAMINEGYHVITVSRGTDYWDFDLRIKPFVTSIRCDRYAGLSDCNELIWLLGEGSPHNLSYVVDFSAYHPTVVQDAINTLKDINSIKAYFLISTDSVYEVCLKNHTGLTHESDAIRPDSAEEREALGQVDSYGHRKLACEEILQANRKAGSGFPYVIFRLPDVIGPRDTTNRWWTYQMWMESQVALDIPITIPLEVDKLRFSLVYVKDVAKILMKAIRAVGRGTLEADKIMNVAFDEVFSLRSLLDKMQSALQLTGIQYRYTNKDKFYLYPSISKGPLNISTAKSLLNWEPTQSHKAILETVRFYRSASDEFKREKQEIVKIMLDHVVPSDYKDRFLADVEEKLNTILTSNPSI